MFTGIVMAVGTITETRPAPGGAVRMTLDAGALDLDDVAPGHSIAVNGVCLTVVDIDAPRVEFDLSRETLNCTAGFMSGARVNLEKSLRLADRLGGHLVGGHVDGVGTVTRFEEAGDNRLLAIAAPHELARYIARKGSIAVNGVSLTVNAVHGSGFEVNLIPHTLAMTDLGALAPGARVNLEVDMLARYIEQLMAAPG
ncbi:MAG TPA: riboflavin synthase [Burkholderiales bacterium]|nr:riboflavin synthase [Burkholderiales bacterium]